jgi:hypothetical protein
LDVPVGGDIGGLRRRQEELELSILKPVATLGDQSCRSQEFRVDVVEGQLNQFDIGMNRYRTYRLNLETKKILKCDEWVFFRNEGME